MANMHDADNKQKDAGNDALPKDGEDTTSGTPSDNGEGGNEVPATWEEVFKHSRFKALNDSNQDLKKKIADFEAAEKKAAEEAEEAANKQLEADQKWQELAEKEKAKAKELRAQVKSLEEDVAAYQETAAKDIEARMSAYPEPLQNLLKPLMEGKTPIEQLTILQEQNDTIQSLLPSDNGDGENKKPPRGVPPTPKPGDEKVISEGEKKKFAANYRLSLRQGL